MAWQRRSYPRSAHLVRTRPEASPLIHLSEGDTLQTEYAQNTAAPAAKSPLHEVVRALQVENEQLRHALHTRTIIEQAKGAVAVRCAVPPDVAFEMLGGLAQSQRQDLADFCAEVMENEGRLDARTAGTAASRSRSIPDRLRCQIVRVVVAPRP